MITYGVTKHNLGVVRSLVKQSIKEGPFKTFDGTEVTPSEVWSGGMSWLRAKYIEQWGNKIPF